MSNCNESDAKRKELNKAIAFLLNKQMEHIPIEDKKQFLLKQLPEDVVNTAIEMLPTIEESIQSNSCNSDSDNGSNVHSSIFASLFDIGIISTALLTSLLFNYICDVNRDKKNAFFLKNIESHLKQETTKSNTVLKDNISSLLSSYVEKKSLPNEISSHLELFSQGKGLTINPSLSKLKSDISSLQADITSLNSKVDTNNFMVTQQIQSEVQKSLSSFLNKQ